MKPAISEQMIAQFKQAGAGYRLTAEYDLLRY
jgi:hypothetical protein